MGKVFIQGGALALAGIAAVLVEQILGLGLGYMTLGLIIGGILGFSTQGSPLGRVLAFLLGILVGAVVYVLRVLVLNESAAGEALGPLIGLALITLVCGLTAGRLPLISALLGSALIVGSYEATFQLAPQNVATDLFPLDSLQNIPATATFAAAFGYLWAVLVTSLVGSDSDEKTERSGEQGDSSTVSLSKSEG